MYIKLILLIATIVCCNAQPLFLQSPQPVAIQAPFLAEELPEPYQFAYTSTDEFGTTLVRQESSDASGVVKGSYGYTDAQGLTRFVEYIADDAGFRATVRTNEPGIISSNPADVLIQSTAAQRRR